MITKVHPTKLILMGNIAAPGYWVDFISATISGQAIFVPANADEQLSGQSYYVETNYEAIRDYQIMTEEKVSSVSIKPLSNPGDYEVVAEVKFVLLTNNEINNPLVYVEVGEARFALTTNELGEQVPNVGDVVSFKLKELSLWDENI